MEVLVTGQGLAGTAVAWELYRRGVSFAIADPGDSDSASRVAAGLITPVAGKRFAMAEHFTQLYARAQMFYADLEALLRVNFLRRQPALRLCYAEEEVGLFQKRAAQLLSSGNVDSVLTTPLNNFHKSLLSFGMPQAARLDTQTYLAESRRFFASQNVLLVTRIEPSALRVTSDGVESAQENLHAKHVVFCGGYHDQDNPWLPRDVFNSAKGEMLTVKIPGLNETRTVHALKSWLCPLGADDLYLFGATYQHDPYDVQTTANARRELEQRLAAIITRPFLVVDHTVGVRPIGMQRKVIVGRHGTCSHIAWLNGLGSKGALLSPYLAKTLVDSLMSETPISVDLYPAITLG